VVKATVTVTEEVDQLGSGEWRRSENQSETWRTPHCRGTYGRRCMFTLDITVL
jgi:hypothetical protein